VGQLNGLGMMSRRTRKRMVERLRAQGISDNRVLNAMEDTPRHIFLDEAMAHRAYDDCSLPIGYGQTLSQPWVVARMTELLLSLGVPEKVLEIGTGSGYQTAVLAKLVDRIISVERIEQLQNKAKNRHYELGFNNIRYRHSDGELGCANLGPYNGIISTAAPAKVPQSLLDQLAPNGVLVIPVGGTEQCLHFFQRQGDSDEFIERKLEPVTFVPLVGGQLIHA